MHLPAAEQSTKGKGNKGEEGKGVKENWENGQEGNRERQTKEADAGAFRLPLFPSFPLPHS